MAASMSPASRASAARSLRFAWISRYWTYRALSDDAQPAAVAMTRTPRRKWGAARPEGRDDSPWG